MSDANPYSPPNANVEEKRAPIAAVRVPPGEPVGLGGWLALICIGLILSPIRIALTVIQSYLPIFRDGTWGALLDSTSVGYHPGLAALTVIELLVNCALAALSIWLLVLFFRRSQRFPKQAIALYAASAIFIFGDTAALSAMGFEAFNPDSMREVVRALISAVVWIPYMLLSRRVKNTFVEE